MREIERTESLERAEILRCISAENELRVLRVLLILAIIRPAPTVLGETSERQSRNS